MHALDQGALAAGIVPRLSHLIGLTATIRHDGPLPVSLAHYRVATPNPVAIEAVRKAVACGGVLPEPLPSLAEWLDTQDVFLTGIPMHQQWGLAIPIVRSRRLLWSFDQRFWCAATGTPLPDTIHFDPGDGLGARQVRFGETLLSVHPTGDTVTYAVTARWGDERRTAQGTIAIGGQPAPLPDETWELALPGMPSGRAFVYHPSDSHSTERLAKPVVIAEGFPGGWACDYLYDMANQHGLIERLRQRGHSVLLLGYDAGTIHIPANAAVVIACLRQITRRSRDPVSLGGVSMGGQITRYALAWLEWTGQSHQIGRAHV